MLTWICRMFTLPIWPVTYFCDKMRSLIDNWKLSGDNWTDPALKQHTDDNTKLAVLWRETRRINTVFISITVDTQDLDQSLITGIGVSTWRPDFLGDSYTSCYHWQVEDISVLDSKRVPNNSHTLTFAKRGTIKKDQIGATVNDIFESLRTKFQRIVVV
ncbi:uncharacterized protein F4807DRAFT_437359, partial [Annulohypoxylon truncatum]|uniref:uncharacterized protein n=1 Tax=Annulohypoxylon truncatum TaxID=327061 RepID=UPI002007E0FF